MADQIQELLTGNCTVFMHGSRSTVRLMVEEMMRATGMDTTDFQTRDRLIMAATKHLDVEVAERNRFHKEIHRDYSLLYNEFIALKEGRARRVLIDLDGVLADFHGHALKFFGSDKTVMDLQGETWIPDVLGITEDEFWEKIHGTAENPKHEECRRFWYDMPLLPDAKEIVHLCEAAVGEENVGICTSPARNPWSGWWKNEWVRNHFPSFIYKKRRMVTTAAKYLASAPGTLLIDDWEKNENFADPKYGGSLYLIPRPWNSRYKEVGTEIQGLRAALASLKKS